MKPGLGMVLLAIGTLAAQDRKDADRRAVAKEYEKKYGRGEGRLKPGDMAPDFNLKTQGKQERVRLSSLRGSRPVALVFGSLT